MANEKIFIADKKTLDAVKSTVDLINTDMASEDTALLIKENTETLKTNVENIQSRANSNNLLNTTINSKIGASDDTGGSETDGTVMGKLNTLLKKTGDFSEIQDTDYYYTGMGTTDELEVFSSSSGSQTFTKTDYDAEYYTIGSFTLQETGQYVIDLKSLSKSMSGNGLTITAFIATTSTATYGTTILSGTGNSLSSSVSSVYMNGYGAVKTFYIRLCLTGNGSYGASKTASVTVGSYKVSSYKKNSLIDNVSVKRRFIFYPQDISDNASYPITVSDVNKVIVLINPDGSNSSTLTCGATVKSISSSWVQLIGTGTVGVQILELQ